MDPNRGRCVVVHGGAGKLRPDSPERLEVLEEATNAAWAALEQDLPGERAVVAALRILEGCEYFNAGYGGYPNSNGIVLLDVGLMRGTREFVSLLNVRKMKFPSEAALDLLLEGQHSMFIWTHEMMQRAESATPDIRTRYGLVASHEELIAPYVRELMAKKRMELEAKPGVGTVGCVLRDSHGGLFAGTSTGGVSMKSNGRIGDSPIIAAGVYADNEIGALSTSGHGEAVLATGISSMLLAELRRTMRADRDAFCKNPTLLQTLVTSELSEFSRKAPTRCVGMLVVPPQGRLWCDVRGGLFSVSTREEGDHSARAKVIGAT